MSRTLALLTAAVVALGLGLTAQAAPRATMLTGVVNLNTASEADLEALPGVGPAKAQRILEVREKHRFASTDQVMQVKGIGRKSYQKLKPFLAVSGPTTLTEKAKAATPKAHAQSED